MGQPEVRDVAASLVPEYAEPWDKEVEKRVVRKIDFILIPFMWFGYGLVYYDKAILGGAAVFGMIPDLGLRTVVNPNTNPPRTSTLRLSWATSMFYFGMLAGLFPLTYLFQRFNLGRTIGIVIILWGTTCLCTAAVTDFRGLYAQRFFLGFAESIVPTSFMVIVSGYYTQAEQTWRQCLWYSATGAWTIIGALFNYAFAHIVGGDLRKWQYLYLMAGSLTVLYGIAFLFFPNTPASAWWFNEEEKRVAIERLRMGQMGVRCQKIKWFQIREAVLDPKVWLIAIMMGAAYVVNGAVSGFGPLIVSTFGWNSYQSLLWQMPLGVVCWIMILLVGYTSLYVRNVRLIMVALNCLPVIAGCIMIWKSSWYYHASTPIAGYTIIGFFAPVTSLIVSLGMANVAGASKKSFMSSAIFVFYCVGNIVGPQLVKTETVAQHYPRLWTGIIVCYCLIIVLCGILFTMLRMENARRDKLNLQEKEAEKIAFDDLTDKQNPYFRFPIRRAALRFISTPSVSFAARSRTIVSLNSTHLRSQKQTSALIFQKRWASDETVKGDAPISKLQPTPQEEVENAISEDNAARTVESSTEPPSDPVQPPTEAAPAIAETANATEATDDVVAQESSVDPAINARSTQYSGANAATHDNPSDGRNQPKPTVYVGNLFFDVTEDDLMKEVSRFGSVNRVKLIRDARGLSKGFGYVTFSSTEEATKAIQALNQQLFEGRRLIVSYASMEAPSTVRRQRPARPLNPPSRTLFIGNMSWEMTDADLNQLFKGIKNVVDVRVAIDRRTGQPRGFAHADFTDIESAMEGFKELSNKETHGRRLKLDYSYQENAAPRNQTRDQGAL